MDTLQNDRILQFTKIVALLVVPILVLAFLILYFYPEQSGQRFAWPIKPSMTAMFMGAGYIGGAWLFANAVIGRHWHRIAPGFPAVTTFTVAMLAATLLHWDKFDPRHLPFILWLGLYVVTPFLVPLVWLRNRFVDSGQMETGDVKVPAAARVGLLLLGLILLSFAIGGFVSPAWLLRFWPWELTPLTARVLSGWFALLGVGGVTISREKRWSSWRVGLQSIGLWHVLVVVAAFVRRADFPGGLVNWYLGSVILVLVGMLLLFVYMEGQQRRIQAHAV